MKNQNNFKTIMLSAAAVSTLCTAVLFTVYINLKYIKENLI